MSTPITTTREVTFPDGTRWPAMGLGTWQYGETRAHREAEVATLRTALDIGYRVFDTAEMYGEGGAETVLGQALAEALGSGLVRRDELFIVTKVYPHNAGAQSMRRACDASRRRLGLDRIDLYLLHWRGSVPLTESVAAFEDLRARGWIDRWGVSNFDTADLNELATLPDGDRCAANQVYHSLTERGPEFELLPWQRRHAMPLMAYSPIDQGALVRHKALSLIARDIGATTAQLALAALLAQPGVQAIPKTRNVQRLRENWAAMTLRLAPQVLAELDRLFPSPRRKRPLATR